MGSLSEEPDIRDDFRAKDWKRLEENALERIEDIRDTRYDSRRTIFIAEINDIRSEQTESGNEYWILTIKEKDTLAIMNPANSPYGCTVRCLPVIKEWFTPKAGQILYMQENIDTPKGICERFLITENDKLIYAQLHNDKGFFSPDLIADDIFIPPFSEAQESLRMANTPAKIYDAVIAGADINQPQSDGSPILFNMLQRPDCFVAAIHCGADINTPHKYWKNPDGTPLTIEDVINSNPEKFKEVAEILEKVKAGKIQKIPGKIDANNEMLQFLARRTKGITAKVEPNTERAEIVKVRTNARDKETVGRRAPKGHKFEEAIITRDKNGKVTSSSYIPLKTGFRDNRKR